MRTTEPVPHWPDFGLGMAALPHKPMSVEQLTSLMTFALRNGVQLFDTAANYHEGQAELCLENALSLQGAASSPSMVADRIVVSKIGQLTQAEFDRRLRLVGSGRANNWDFSYGYLSEMLHRSVDRLSAFSYKYVLLHNPEEALATSGDKLSALDDACLVLEEAVSGGHINAWGISSWSGLYTEAGRPGHIDLANLFDGLDERFDAHHCKIIEAPMGLWNLHQFKSTHQKRRLNGQPTNIEGFCQEENLRLLLNATFDGGNWSPQQSDDPVLRGCEPADILQLCKGVAPTGCRIVGASQSGTIENLLRIYNVL